MKRRSFLQSIIAGLTALFVPKSKAKSKLTENKPTDQSTPEFREIKAQSVNMSDEEFIGAFCEETDLSAQKEALAIAIETFMDAPDFKQVVGTIKKMRKGVFAEPLRKAIEARPQLIKYILQSINPARTAYILAKMNLNPSGA